MKVTVAYLRVSTEEQDVDKNKSDIVLFANARKMVPVRFVEEKISGVKSWRERKIKDIIEELGNGDNLIVPELSRLGRSMLEIMEILAIATKKKINVYALKGNWELNGSIQSKVVAMAFAMAAEIERDLISERTKEALRARKAAGVKLGRPPGVYRSKLDKHRPEIEALLANGSTQVFIAQRYGISKLGLWKWLKKHGIEVPKPNKQDSDNGELRPVQVPKNESVADTRTVSTKPGQKRKRPS